MITDDEDEEREESSCPFCGSTGDCPHLLLLVDKTFQEVSGGVLFDAFNARLSSDDISFDELLDEVDSLADAYDRYNFEDGPGSSSTYEVYYVSSAARAKKAKSVFAAGSKRP